ARIVAGPPDWGIGAHNNHFSAFHSFTAIGANGVSQRNTEPLSLSRAFTAAPTYLLTTKVGTPRLVTITGSPVSSIRQKISSARALNADLEILVFNFFRSR